MKVFAVLLAAGRSERMGFDKIRFPLRGKPVWRHSFDALHSHPEIAGVGIVGDVECPEADFVIAGGDSRTASSKNGIVATPEWAEIVLIHDAARPFVSAEVISRVIQGVREAGASTPGIPSADTIKRIGRDGLETLPREELVATQTPQGALREQLLSLYRVNNQEFTDDMAMLEANGMKPKLVAGDPRNFKITTPEDLARAAAMLGAPETRTGIGYDIHRFSPDPERELWLGGIRFEGAPGLDGHSDADVILHAVVDSLLGAASLGDIGAIFPNTDPQWKNEPSIHFVRYAADELGQRGWDIVHIDIAVIAEMPKVMPRALEIRTTLAGAIGCDLDRVSIKATTNETLGAIGRGEGIAAFATATIRQRF